MFVVEKKEKTEVPEQAQHQSFIPGMSAYDSQDASVDVGTAKCIGNLSFSTKSAHCEEYTIFSQTSDVESDAFSVFSYGLFDGLSHFPLSLSIASVGKKIQNISKLSK